MNTIDPLFALEAEQLLLSGFTDDAIDLCKRGIEAYPDYALAFVILARAYEQTADIDALIKVIENAESRCPNNKVFAELKVKYKSELIQIEEIDDVKFPISELSESPKIEEDKEDLSITNNVNFEITNDTQQLEKPAFRIKHLIDDTLENISNTDRTNDLSFELKSFYDVHPPMNHFKPYSYHFYENLNTQNTEQFDLPALISEDNFFDAENLSRLVQNISNATIQIGSDDIKKTKAKSSDSNEPLLITETMASIYASQGQFDAALKAYSELRKSNPEKSYYFQEKINEIKALKEQS